MALFELSVLPELSVLLELNVLPELSVIELEVGEALTDAVTFFEAVAVELSCLLARRRRGGEAKTTCSTPRMASKVLKYSEVKQSILKMMSRHVPVSLLIKQGA